MSLRKLYAPQAFERPKSISWDAPSQAISEWASKPYAAEAENDATISIYEYIGEDAFMGGFGAKRMAGILRSIGDKPVTVNINSPGGDFFDGVAIYNLLREHPQSVTVKVMGVAASAASIIAMAGDKILMGAGTSMMIHNAWGVVVGNQNDFREAADTFEIFDASMLSIYAARSGGTEKEIKKMMDAETFVSADDAVKFGFADEVVNLPVSKQPEQDKASAKKQFEAILAKEGVPRSERRKLFRELTSTQDAADDVMSSADIWPMAEMKNLLKTLTV